jgi:hypothetical protein
MERCSLLYFLVLSTSSYGFEYVTGLVVVISCGYKIILELKKFTL